MTRTAYDALVASGIPHGAQVALWYPHDSRGDGPPRDAHLVLTIDNRGTHPDCHVLDVESGAASFASVPRWLDENRNQYPTIYCSQFNVQRVVEAAGGRHWHLWVADWNGAPTEIFEPGDPTVTTVAHQYASNRRYDTSVVYDRVPWYGYPPVKPPASVPYPLPAGQYFGLPPNHDGSDTADRKSIKLIQMRVGFTGSDVDGIYGPKTTTAVEVFQKGHPPLSVDGVTGPHTWAAMFPAPKLAETTPASGVQQEGSGHVSMSRVAQLKNISPEAIILQTLKSGTPEDVAAFVHYCGSSLMQQGLVYYLPPGVE